MTETRHTPGPWRVDGCDRRWSVETAHGTRRDAYKKGYYAMQPTGIAFDIPCAADAALIAAAPDLLEAAKECLPIIAREAKNLLATIDHTQEDSEGKADGARSAAEALRAAIARAEAAS